MKLLYRTAALHAALFVVCLLLFLFDSTQILGINRWIKPMKFSASISIYLATMAWFWPVAIAAEKAKDRAAKMLAGTMIIESVLITMQAARGVRSHFNNDSPMDEMLFTLMGVAIIVNVGTAVAVCAWTFRAAPSAYVWGIRLGLILFAGFAMEGAVMVARMAHAVGAADGGPGLPFVNWSTRGGDLRVAHFFGMHALQAIPLVGYVTRSTPAVAAAFAVWTALSIAALWRALAGVPLIAG